MEATKKEMSWFYVFIEAPLLHFLARQPLTKPLPHSNGPITLQQPCPFMAGPSLFGCAHMLK